MPLTPYCTYCGEAHSTSLCPSSYGGSAARAHLHCTYCGSAKHTIDYCRDTAAGESNRRRDPNGTFLD